MAKSPGLADRLFRRLGTGANSTPYAKVEDGAPEDSDDESESDAGAGAHQHTKSNTFKGRAEHGFISKTLFLWVSPFLKLGGERMLQLEDLLPLPPHYLAANNSKRFESLLKDAMAKEERREREAREWEDAGWKPKRRPFLPELVWPLWTSFGATILTGSFFKLCNDIIQFIPPLVLGGFLRYIAGKDHFLEVLDASDDTYGVVYCAMLFFIPVVRTLCEQTYFYFMQASGICIKGALATAVYRKTTRLSAAGREGSTTGEVLNHMQLDAQRVGDTMFFINVLWSGILQIAGYMTILYFYLGWAAIGGFGVMVVLVPLQKTFFRWISKLRSQQMVQTDRRVKMQNEALSGIKILKLNAWEEPLREEVEAVRAEEMLIAGRVANRNAMNMAIMNAGPTLVAVAAFSLYSGVMKRPMTPSVIFPSLSLFSLLRFPVMFYPRCLSLCADAFVALRRLQKYFLMEESRATTVTLPVRVDGDARGKTTNEETPAKAPASEQEKGDETLTPEVEVKDLTRAASSTPAALAAVTTPIAEEVASVRGGYFHWTALKSPTEEPFLKDINLSLKKGQLTVVVGPVGAGKSALIGALLGEMYQCAGPAGFPASDGAPDVRGTVAYVAQVAWVQSLSLKENVLFGKRMDEERYRNALDVACLDADVRQLPHGDETEIGEKGITLSGGQKQRTAIARAAYADADLIVMDDPLSALDAHVAKDVFQKCIVGAFKDKAVLLVTHSLGFVSQADHVICMSNGKIAEEGTYDELVSKEKGAFKALMESFHGEEEEEEGVEVGDVRVEEVPSTPVPAAAEEEEEEDASSEGRIGDLTESAAAEAGGDPSVAAKRKSFEKTPLLAAAAGGVLLSSSGDAKGAGAGGNTMTKEVRQEGAVKFKTYWTYITNMGTPSKIVWLLTMVTVERAMSVMTSVWLALWSERHWEDMSNDEYLAGYAGLGIGQAIVSWFRTFAWALASLAAANTLHLALFKATMSTRMSFFDTTPLGRVIQRFTKDTATLDNNLGQSVSSFASFFILLIGTLTVMAWVMPILVPCLVPIAIMYYYVQRFFRPGYREAKRLDGISGSPIYAHFGETLTGISTIRAFGHQRRFIAENEMRISVNQRADYTQKCACDRWLPIRLETIGNSITLVVAILGVWNRGTTYAALVGLTISYAIDMTGLLSWLIRVVSELESNMVSVERVSEYAELESEEATGAVMKTGGGSVKKPTHGWPDSGAITFENLQLRYRPGLPLVLNGVSFNVQAGEKVGICGRTGSGKSSLIVALWRLVEPCGGAIWLDGVDVSTIPLKTLRSAVTCIPQDPILFSGTVRDNLDPFKNHADAELWFALEAVQLKKAVSEMGEGLDAPVAEYGENYSAGQRQMLCLARALLRDTKVVCLDEATASVDLETDKVMQDVIAEQFKARTILTIAHRINTIIENDKVVCLERGELVAMDAPATMLLDENSMFAKLVAETGEQSARNLRARAEECEAARAAGRPIRRIGSKLSVASNDSR